MCALPGRGGCWAALPVFGWVGRSQVLPAHGWPRTQASPWAGSPELPPASAGAPGSSLPYTSASARRAGLRSPPGKDERRRPQHRPSSQSGPAAACHGRRGGRRHPANVSQQRHGGRQSRQRWRAAGLGPHTRPPPSFFPSLLGTGVQGCDLGWVGNALGWGRRQGSASCGVSGSSSMGWEGSACPAAPRCIPLHPTASSIPGLPPLPFCSRLPELDVGLGQVPPGLELWPRCCHRTPACLHAAGLAGVRGRCYLTCTQPSARVGRWPRLALGAGGCLSDAAVPAGQAGGCTELAVLSLTPSGEAGSAGVGFFLGGVVLQSCSWKSPMGPPQLGWGVCDGARQGCAVVPVLLRWSLPHTYPSLVPVPVWCAGLSRGVLLPLPHQRCHHASPCAAVLWQLLLQVHLTWFWEHLASEMMPHFPSPY